MFVVLMSVRDREKVAPNKVINNNKTTVLRTEHIFQIHSISNCILLAVCKYCVSEAILWSR